jgi:predicted metal-dependent enzyme (double-stranded beta helix superfamily)/rhodanese-related sulfurtransferase
MAAAHRLREFIHGLADIVETSRHGPALLESGAALLRQLVAQDDWLPEIYAWPDPERYRQYLLYCDPAERFSVVSFVWGPGQATPIHDHRVWGLIGVLRGAEKSERFIRGVSGRLQLEGHALLRAGDVDAVGPDIGDIHRVSNAVPDAVSVSIHVYGGNIGAVERATYGEDGAPKRFISGYANDALPNLWDRSGNATKSLISAEAVRQKLLLGEEIAIIDVREEAEFALGHPLFAAQIPLRRLELEAPWRLPRRDVQVVVYDNGEGPAGASLAEDARAQLLGLGYRNALVLQGGLSGWRAAGYELFQDVNSYSKAFGELVEHRRHTPSLPAEEVQALLAAEADAVVLDARRFDEFNTMSIPTGISVPGAELVLSAPALAPRPETTIIVNCAGRTRSLIGTQSLINAGLPNRIVALRNGTIGWTLAGQRLAHGKAARAPEADEAALAEAQRRSRAVADRAGVKRLRSADLTALQRDSSRTLYRFDVRQPELFAAGHLPGFRSAPGGQLVQETDHYAPVRGSRIVLADDFLVRADMTASWLAQMGWEVYVLEDGYAQAVVSGGDGGPAARGPEGRYKRPYEGTENKAAAMQAYLDWEFGLVAQLQRDGTHGFFVI